jgi:hypothetical protein
MPVNLHDYSLNGKRKPMKEVRDLAGKYAVLEKVEGDKCPIATQDVAVNLKNREKAIKTAAYGPLNPAEPNTDFWAAKGKRWDLPIADAKKSLCGNWILLRRENSDIVNHLTSSVLRPELAMLGFQVVP